MKVDFVDLSRQYEFLKDRLESKALEVLRSGSYVLGKYTETFEEAFAEHEGGTHCVAVSSGTMALYVTLLALEIGPGDEVILPNNTFIATAEAVSLTGATPVLVDVDDEDYTLDVSDVEAAVTARTAAVIAVNLYGHPARLRELEKLADKYGVYLIQDSCQAHGALYNGVPLARYGIASCYSFYPSKNLGACGEGGAVVTNTPWLAERIRMIRDHGSRKKYSHEIVGGNFRMSAIQAALLNEKLSYLDLFNSERRKAAQWYGGRLSSLRRLILPEERDYAYHVYHLYVVRVLGRSRDRLRSRLQRRGVYTGIHYPATISDQPAYQSKTSCIVHPTPVATRVVQEIISLPMFPFITEDEVNYVCEVLAEELS